MEIYSSKTLDRNQMTIVKTIYIYMFVYQNYSFIPSFDIGYFKYLNHISDAS